MYLPSIWKYRKQFRLVGNCVQLVSIVQSDPSVFQLRHFYSRDFQNGNVCTQFAVTYVVSAFVDAMAANMSYGKRVQILNLKRALQVTIDHYFYKIVNKLLAH